MPINKYSLEIKKEILTIREVALFLAKAMTNKTDFERELYNFFM